MNRNKLRKVTEAKKDMIKDVFKVFDEDHDGYLDYLELKAALKALGFPVKKVEAIKILETYDKNEQRYIDYDDFKTIAIDKMMRQDPVDEMKYAYKLISGENSSGITYKDLQKVVDLIGLDISREEVEGMINEFDTDGDGLINEEEFLKIMLPDDEYC